MNEPGCQSATLARNDDDSTGPVDIGFPIDFFGKTYSQVFVNNNGNVTFDDPLSTYTPFAMTGPTGIPIISPFFSDLDTRNPASGVVHFGQTTYQGNQAFCVDWFTRNSDGTTTGVGYFSQRADKLNVFQLLLVNRATDSQTPGDFDVVFNYDSVEWESSGSGGLGGSCARAGYSDGTGAQGRSFEVEGSGRCGALLDTNMTTGLANSTNLGASQPDGRWVFEVRSGQAPTGGSIGGTVKDTSGSFLSNVPVYACKTSDENGNPIPEGQCGATRSKSSGSFLISPLSDGTYVLRAMPIRPQLGPAVLGPVVVEEGSDVTNQNLTLQAPVPPPPGVEITPDRRSSDGIPIIHFAQGADIQVQGCRNAHTTIWSLTIPLDDATGESFEITGTLVEVDPERPNVLKPGSGVYVAHVPPIQPHHGLGTFTWRVTCDGLGGEHFVTDTFNVYIDPSGVVQDTNGALVEGATVTLFRSEGRDGPFAQVPDQDAIMSPSNRRNPDSTDAVGHFGWDVIAGYYVVRAEAPGCTSPTDPEQAFVETEALRIPPPVTDLVLVLKCPVSKFSSAVRLTRVKRGFKGVVSSTGSMCVQQRTVTLSKQRKGGGKRIARKTTRANGAFRFARLRHARGLYFATALARTLEGMDATRVICAAAVSRHRKLGRSRR